MVVANLASLVASLPNPAIVVDDDGLVRASNDHADALLGSHLVDRTVESLMPERYRGRHVRSRMSFGAGEASRPMGLGRELHLLAADGTEIPAEIGLSRISTTAGSMTLAILVDARVRNAHLAVLEARARTDSLTGLANRAAADEDLARRMRARAPFCVLAADLDGLRDTNTRFGHHGGDTLLKAFGRRLRAVLREEDLVARTGGDEFLVAVGATRDDAIRVAVRVTGAGAAPIEIAGEKVPLFASVGIAERRPGDSRMSLTARADAALFAAKAAGRCAVAVLLEGDGPPVVVQGLPPAERPDHGPAGGRPVSRPRRRGRDDGASAP